MEYKNDTRVRSESEILSLKTDSLGFSLTVVIKVGDYPVLGSYVTYQISEGEVIPSVPHTLKFKTGLTQGMLTQIIAHEAFHLFAALRHLITEDEEKQAEVFGELVRKIFDAYLSHESPVVSEI